MKIFTKKSSTQKIILTVLIVILCNFIFPTYSRAGIGGILFDPITNLVTTVGDSILAILQNFLYNGEYNVVSGLSSIMLKAGFFVNNRDKYPDMDYTGNTSWSEEEAKENGVAVIDEDEFDQISLYDAAAFLVNPDDVVEVAMASRRIQDDNKLREKLVYLGRKNINRFDGNSRANLYWSVIINDD